jgi:glutamate formiminotransferase/formiminotetrahydrofolate cyclodeaminase
MTQLVECIPNFSDARPEVVDQLVAALTAVPEIQLLDRSCDADHNRSVLTFVGPPQAVEEAAFRAIRKAAELIDLNRHSGVHPRIGATDVVPFVPLAGVTMDECVEIARRLGKRVGAVLGIPVYLYANAALRPERTQLENIRKGQYEGLKTEIGTNPGRAPDFGPARLGSAGATAIGARPALIAFNVYLTTADVEIAKKIAKSVRQSSGGLPHVKALGLLVGGRAQVSMNLTDFREMPLHLVVATVRAEARQAGVDIHHSELIGLIPQAALSDTAIFYLQLNGFTPNQVLETHLGSTVTIPSNHPTFNPQPATLQLSTFLEALASPTPLPASGSVAAYSAAMAAGLVSMVAGGTIGKKNYADVEAEMKTVHEKAENLRRELAQAISEDAHAFEQVLAAFKLPASDRAQEKTRNEAVEQAAIHTLQVALNVARKAVEVMSLAERCAQIGNLVSIADAASAVSIARAALVAAGYNVRINADTLQKKANGESFVFELDALEGRAARINRQTRHILRERAGLKLE